MTVVSLVLVTCRSPKEEEEEVEALDFQVSTFQEPPSSQDGFHLVLEKDDLDVQEEKLQLFVENKGEEVFSFSSYYTIEKEINGHGMVYLLKKGQLFKTMRRLLVHPGRKTM